MMFFLKKPTPVNSKILILYGTQTGNSKMVAQQAQKYLEKYGITSDCYNMSGFDPVKLALTQKLLIVVSTHGDGHPPPPAKRFFEKFMSDSMPQLQHLHYTVCALGDSSYMHFCKAGHSIHKRLTELGASAFLPCNECDVSFADDALKWIKQSAAHII